MQVFETAVWFFAFFGFIVVFSLAWIGFKMVALAIGFSVQYSYSEYKNKKLKKASEATRAAMGPKVEDIGEGEDEGSKAKKPSDKK